MAVMNMVGAMPISTAPRDGRWFNAVNMDGLFCKARIVTISGPSNTIIEAVFSEFGAHIYASHWKPCA